MTYKLFLDDIRDPRTTPAYFGFDDDFFKDMVIARSYDEAAKILHRNGLPYVLLLDYHLGDNNYSGFDVVKHFISKAEIDPSELDPDFKYYIHTDSQVCGLLMEKALKKFLERIGR